jgi:hypothetical protein
MPAGTKAGGGHGARAAAREARRAAPGAPRLVDPMRAPARDGPRLPPYKLARVADLVPSERNARTHTPAQIDTLCRLIEANGWTNPILVAGRDILAGHARHAAALKLGLVTVPTIDLSHLTAAERRAVILSDNRSALDAGWDNELLASELGELRDLGFDLSLTGFGALELGTLLGEPDAPDPAPPAAGGKTIVCPACRHEFAP